jgi:hypothetical protein
MSTAGKFMRRGADRYFHWCPACEEAHPLPDRWTFNGNLDAPTFSPSFRHTGKQIEKINGKWTGEWVRDAAGKPLDWCCHYILTNGVLNFCGDCTHAMAGKSVPMVPWPEGGDDE